MPDAAATETLSPFSIAPATGVGAVHLAVTDGEQALAFYRDVLGLALLSRTGEEIRLGAGGRELVVLTPGASRQVLDRTTGRLEPWTSTTSSRPAEEPNRSSSSVSESRVSPTASR